MAEDSAAESKALTRCLLVMAGADKTLTLSEVETVAKLYAEASGRQVDPELISEIFVETRNLDATEALADLRQVADQLGDATKEQIVKASYAVMVADNKVDRRETERLSEIGEALGLAAEKVAALSH